MSKRPSHVNSCWQAHSKRAAQTVTLLVITAIVYIQLTYHYIDHAQLWQRLHNQHVTRTTCLPDYNILRQLGVSPTIQYAQSRFLVEFSDEELNFTESINRPSPQPGTLNLSIVDGLFGDHNRSSTHFCSSPITVKVARPKPRTDASNIVFGVSTTTDRLKSSISQLQHWLPHTGARLIALVPPNNSSGLLQTQMRALGIEVTIKHSNQSFNDRYIALTKVLYEQRQPSTQWAGFIDDDTFYLSMPELVSRLSTYDHRQEKYIGGLTEDFVQLRTFGYMGYGGAGIFLSMPLLQNVYAAFDECKIAPGYVDGSSMNGDGLLAQCIYHHTTAKFSWEPTLHQIDLSGDPSGFYEAGRQQPLSIHHWKHWFPVDVVQMSAVSYISGDASLLKRWKFSDGWYLVNGYSFFKYGDETIDDGAMELTWDPSKAPPGFEGISRYEHSLTPIRAKDEQKMTYKLEHVMLEEQQARQFYVYRPGHGLEDRVLELIWARKE